MSIESPLRRHIETVEQVVLDRHRKYSASNISNSPGGPLNGLRVRLHDKLARLSNFVDGGAEADFEDDSLRDCFTDIVGYGLIGLLVLAGEWPGAEVPEAESRHGRIIEIVGDDPERVGAKRRCPDAKGADATVVVWHRLPSGWGWAWPGQPPPAHGAFPSLAALEGLHGRSVEVP